MSSTVAPSGSWRVATYATCAFALALWAFVPAIAMVSALVCIALVSVRPPERPVERWIVQLLATAALLLAAFVTFGQPTGTL